MHGPNAVGGGGKQYFFYVVGNAPMGDVAADCDYLDLGDGVQLDAAIAAAGLLAVPVDVYVRPGVYDFNLGALAAPITVPYGVTVRGSGYTTNIRTWAGGLWGAFRLEGARPMMVPPVPPSRLEDLTISVPVPLVPTPFTGNSAIVHYVMGGSEVRRVNVDFENFGWMGVDPLNVPVFDIYVFQINPGSGAFCRSKLLECSVFNLFAFDALPGPPGTTSYGVWVSNNNEWIAIDKNYLQGGDVGIYNINSPIEATNNLITDLFGFLRQGMYVRCSGTKVMDNRIILSGAAGTRSGLLLDGVNGCRVLGNELQGGLTAIQCLSTTNSLISNNRGGLVTTAVSLDAGSSGDIVLGNNFGVPYVDLGALNDLAHNK